MKEITCCDEEISYTQKQQVIVLNVLPGEPGNKKETYCYNYAENFYNAVE
jgi:hypothetical protein